GAAEPRQNLLRDDRLYEEQQERADEYGCGVEEHRDRSVPPSGQRRGDGKPPPFYRTQTGAETKRRGENPAHKSRSFYISRSRVRRGFRALSTWSVGGSTRRDRSSEPRAPGHRRPGEHAVECRIPPARGSRLCGRTPLACARRRRLRRG